MAAARWALVALACALSANADPPKVEVKLPIPAEWLLVGSEGATGETRWTIHPAYAGFLGDVPPILTRREITFCDDADGTLRRAHWILRRRAWSDGDAGGWDLTAKLRVPLDGDAPAPAPAWSPKAGVELKTEIEWGGGMSASHSWEEAGSGTPPEPQAWLASLAIEGAPAMGKTIECGPFLSLKWETPKSAPFGKVSIEAWRAPLRPGEQPQWTAELSFRAKSRAEADALRTKVLAALMDAAAEIAGSKTEWARAQCAGR